MDGKQIEKLRQYGRDGYSEYRGGHKTPISESVMNVVIDRDNICVYCRAEFGNTRCNMATWEHINNDTRDVEEWNIALACGSCNYSRAHYTKLKDWFEKAPRGKTIDQENLADVIVKYINKYEKTKAKI